MPYKSVIPILNVPEMLVQFLKASEYQTGILMVNRNRITNIQKLVQYSYEDRVGSLSNVTYSSEYQGVLKRGQPTLIISSVIGSFIVFFPVYQTIRQPDNYLTLENWTSPVLLLHMLKTYTNSG